MPEVRWDPFRDLIAIQERMNRLFETALSGSDFEGASSGIGGWSPAARFLTPLTPLLGLSVLAGLRAIPKGVAVAAIAVQAAISAYAWQHPKVLWNEGDGRAAICEAVGDSVCRRLPSLARQ